MGLREIASADFKTNIDRDGEEVILTSPLDVEYQVKGTVFRTDVIVDPATGIKIHEPRTAVSVHLDDLPVELTPEDFQEWFVKTTDITGEEIEGKVASPAFDRTLGFVNFILEAYDEEEQDG
jgi:hypothetical protein